ncbi:MAG TPA: hypothetical protein VEP90_26475 [Methylomirabilota bacterium]|nr:hypothetical protein [Methylomirabilota bacterium]
MKWILSLFLPAPKIIRKASPPWVIFWADEYDINHSSFVVPNFRAVVDWVRENYKNYPGTRVVIASKNGYTYSVTYNEKKGFLYEEEGKLKNERKRIKEACS